MADHRVERVGGAEADEPGDTGEGAPDEGADHGVRGVLGDGLHDGARDPGAVQLLWVASAQVRQPLPGQLDVPRGERPADGPGLAPQRRTADDGPGGGGGQGHGRGGVAAQGAGGERGAPGGAPGADQGVQGAPAAVVAPEPVLDGRGGPPESGDRVPLRGSPSSRSPIRPAVAPYA